MKTTPLTKALASLAITALVFSGIGNLSNQSVARAQNGPPGGPGGNFDPQQFRQMMMDRFREQFEVKDDDEWKLIQERIEKVMEARQAAGGFGGMRMGRGPGGPGGRGPMGGQGPEGEALQNALESKASADTLKAKLAQFREARKANQAKLEQAQEELRKVLTLRQEAAAVLAGLLK
jgi:hypothetical protein